MRIGRHRFRLSELGDERGIARHRNANQLVGDRNAVNVERLLAVECQGQRKRLPGRQLPLFMHEAEAPPAIAVDHHDKKDAAGVSGAGCTVRERSGLVVGVGPALPVADADRTVRPARLRIRTGKNRTQQSCDRSSTAFHKLFPHTPRMSIFVFATGVHLDCALGEPKFSCCGRQKNRPGVGFMPAGRPNCRSRFVKFFAGSFGTSSRSS